MKRPVIGICTVRGGVVDFLEFELQRHIDMGFAIHPISPQQIAQQDILNQRPDIVGLFMPGTTSGQYYLDELGKSGIANLGNWLVNGGTAVMICAAAYTCGRVRYRNFEKTIVKDETMNFVDAEMEGELTELLPNHGQKGGLSDADTAPITLHTETGSMQGNVAYWGGPKIKLAPAERQRVKVLATFNTVKDDDGKPAVAAVIKPMGKGSLAMLAVHPEVSGRALRDMKTARSYDRGSDAHRLRMGETLSQPVNGLVRERLMTIATRPMVVAAVPYLGA